MPLCSSESTPSWGKGAQSVADNMIIAFLVAMGTPTAITAFCSWALQRRIMRREKKAEELERSREKLDVMLLQSTTAAIALGRLQPRRCSGSPMRIATGYAQGFGYAADIKHRQKDF